MNIFHMRVHEYTPAAEGSGKIKLPARSAGPKMYVTRAKRELIYVYFLHELRAYVCAKS